MPHVRYLIARGLDVLGYSRKPYHDTPDYITYAEPGKWRRWFLSNQGTLRIGGGSVEQSRPATPEMRDFVIHAPQRAIIVHEACNAWPEARGLAPAQIALALSETNPAVGSIPLYQVEAHVQNWLRQQSIRP